ncbi:MAG: hypothetical protein JO317_08640 [Verrucomicrobiae bacterium]|nr:hypothetical protein [Verrucomicrobiae bacterium]
MTKTTRAMIAAAAVAGLITGATAPKVHAGNFDKNGKAGIHAKSLADAGKHDCKGKNDCKGQGGCKSGNNGCKGKNDCKGKGGCNTNKPAN